MDEGLMDISTDGIKSEKSAYNVRLRNTAYNFNFNVFLLPCIFK